MTDAPAIPATVKTRRPFGFRFVMPLVLGSMLNPINSTIVAVALVPIGVALGAPPTRTAWLVSALYLATALGQPIVGRLIDIFGPRRLFLVSLRLPREAAYLHHDQ